MGFEIGQMVEHQALPELGRARVDRVTRDRLYVTFERRTGGDQKTFVIPNESILLTKDQSSVGFESLKTVKAPGRARATKVKAPARTFEQAWEKFKGKYPKGFDDSMYVKQERSEKAAAQGRWVEQFAPDKLQALLTSGDSHGVANAFSHVYKGLSLLHTLEWLGFQKALKAGANSRALVTAYAAVLAEGTLTEAGFDRLRQAYEGLSGKDLKWTVFTLWPFLGSARGFAFVKPLITRAAAEAMGVALNYKATPNFQTYQACVKVYEALEAKLKPLGAKDWVDVQSFLWIGWKD